MMIMYFTREQMILQVIKFFGEKMDNEKCLFSFEILFLILLCKCFTSYKERDNFKHYMKELQIYLYYFYIFILIFHMGKYRMLHIYLLFSLTYHYPYSYVLVNQFSWKVFYCFLYLYI